MEEHCQGWSLDLSSCRGDGPMAPGGSAPGKGWQFGARRWLLWKLAPVTSKCSRFKEAQCLGVCRSFFF